jgi:hypothetical protein
LDTAVTQTVIVERQKQFFAQERELAIQENTLIARENDLEAIERALGRAHI